MADGTQQVLRYGEPQFVINRSASLHQNAARFIANQNLCLMYTQSEDEKLSLLGATPAIRRERLVTSGAAIPVLDRALPASVTNNAFELTTRT